MPLTKKIETKQLTLPSSKDLPKDDPSVEWVALEVGPLNGGDLLSVDDFKNNASYMANVLLNRIKEWNVKDGEEVAEINIDNLKRLPVTDLTFLINEFSGGEAADESSPKVQIPIGE